MYNAIQNLTNAADSFMPNLIEALESADQRLDDLEEYDLRDLKNNVEDHESRLYELENLDLDDSYERLSDRLEELEQEERVDPDEHAALQVKVGELEDQLAALAPALAAFTALRAALAPPPAEPEVRVEYVEVSVKPTLEEIYSAKLEDVLNHVSELGFVGDSICPMCESAQAIANRVNAEREKAAGRIQTLQEVLEEV